jgi:hypothetical protein
MQRIGQNGETTRPYPPDDLDDREAEVEEKGRGDVAAPVMVMVMCVIVPHSIR